MKTTSTPILLRRPLTTAVLAALALSASGSILALDSRGNDFAGAGDSDRDHRSDEHRFRTPPAPRGVGYVDSAPVADAATTLPYVDFAYTNQRGDACLATKETNAGVRVLEGFLDLWQPSTLLVDAGVSAPAKGDCPAVAASKWSGIPGDSTDGTVLDATALNANIQYVVDATASRSSEQEVAAYVDDRRQKGYSVTDGLGPLTGAWRSAAQQSTTITGIPADATKVLYNDKGNNNGIGGSGNVSFGKVVDFVGNIGENGSTEPAKRFYKYARPWRWSSSVFVVPALEPAKSTTPGTDGGFISGHAAEATRDAIALAYLMPERFQELISRGLELGENRILAGMHSPLDVIGGRIQAQAVATASIATGANALNKTAAYDQAHATLMAAVGAGDLAAFNDYAHSQSVDEDRFADHAINKANYLRRMTYGFAQTGDKTRTATVPKRAEVLLETRLPYLTDAQRRVVLKTTALPSGYPIMDDAEGWGRLNLFAAADGYGAFNGDVVVTMDAGKGGFHALDSWRNDIPGAGKLTKLGSGTLKMTGANRYTGGTQVMAGVLQADSATAFGEGDVYLSGGTVVSNANSELTVAGSYTQLADTTLVLNVGHGGAGQLHVKGDVTVLGGTLDVKFKPGYAPRAGSTLHVIDSDNLRGGFTTVTVEGFSKVRPIYTSRGLMLRLGNDD